MDSLLDESSTRAWPPGGAEPASALLESPPDAEPISIEMLAQRAVDSVESGVSDDPAPKLAELEPTLGVDLGRETPDVKNIWRHENAHPVVLMLLLLDKYGQEYLEWHPDVLKMTLDRDGIALSNKVWNKILAGRVVLMSPSPWRQWEVFHWVCRGLAGESPNFVYLEEPQIGHLVAGFQTMKIVDPSRQTSWEVDKFVAAVFKDEGIPYIPSPLDFAQRELEEPKIECSHCGALHRDDNDIRCVTCGESTLHKVPYEYEANKTEVRDLFEARRNLYLPVGLKDLPDTGTGSAVYRLLVDWSYASEVKGQMIRQLRMIGGK